MSAASDPFASIAQPMQSAEGSDQFAAIAQPIRNSGEQVNDVGNRVIVPKQGENFADTMSRAAAYGKTVTPRQINAEVATAPKKAGQVGLSALLGGAAIPAAEVGTAAYGPGIATALAPLAKKYGIRALEGLSAGVGWEIYQALKHHFEGK
jgi:hypothetical protein